MSDDHESGKWLKVKARAPQNAKWIALSDAAFRLHISVECWCCDEVNDGRFSAHVPAGMPKAPPPNKLPGVIKELVTAGLWKPLADGEYEINDFLKYNMSRAQWEAKKAAGKKGGKLSGESRRNRRRFEDEAPPEAPASAHTEAGASAHASAPAQAPAEHENEYDQRSKNNPPPRDLSGSAPEAPAVVVAIDDGRKVPCPADLILSDDQIKSLEIGQGLNAYQAKVLAGRFCANFGADQTDRRPLAAWLKCLSRFVSAEFANPKHRPPRSADAEETAQQTAVRLKNGTRQTNVLGHLDDEALARKTGAILE
jgi:hypothetical protein